MQKNVILSFIGFIFLSIPCQSIAWGKQGHQIVAQIAEHFISDSTKLKVKKYLGNTTFEEAATWMDESRSNDYYNYMRTWHYINIDKGQQYKPEAQKNILTVLHAAIKEIKDNQKISKSKLKEDLQMVFHLIGDLHQPMHVGYGVDRGGNDINVSYLFKSYNTNLHSVWDTEIIESEKINMDTCLVLYNQMQEEEIGKIKKINELQWFRESRVLLEKCYDFKDGFLDKDYVTNNKTTVKRQLLLGGMRLAAVLEDIFKDK